MAEYRVEFTADSGSAERSIKNLKKEIKGVTKEFESAEIGAGDFIEAASNLSGLQKELKDARREVVDIDGAYKTLSQTMAQFRSGMGARGAISSVASPIRGGAQQFGSPAYFDALNKDLEQAIKEGRQLDTEIQRAAESREQAIANFRTGMGAKGASQVASSVQGTPQQFGSPAYFDALNKSLRMAIDEGRQLDAEIKRAAESREQAIMEFRAGMGAKGAIPAVASPVRGGIEYGPAYGSAGSPAYLEEVARAAKKAQQELDEAAKAAGTIAPPVKAFNPASLAAYEAKLKILKAEARLILPDSKRWKELNKEILKLERGVERINKKQRLGPSARQRAGAAGGAFLYGGGMGGGPGSAVGGIAGGLMGGVPGAFTGAAIGQAVDSLGGALAGITSQAAAVQQLQRGLALASIDAKDFAEAQSAVADVSSRLFIPLEQVTKSFAQLRVNTKQYGLSVEETKQILEGTILAVSAFGGSAEDVDGAMRAVVQILSKGSVQAEELRGQLGERFPGAVIKFAQANKLSFDELQDRLKEGTIGIKEFVTFAKDNYEDYAEFSKTISTAPEFAGRRLAKALEEMQMVIGQVFGSSGATIQDFSSQALKDITKFIVDNKELLAQLAKDFAVVFAGIMSVVAEAGKFIIKVLAPVLSYIGSVIRQLRVMTGAADAATAKAEMDAANVIIQRTGMGRDAYLSGQSRPRSFADKIEFDEAQERYKRAEERFKAAGGKAALPPETGTPPNLVFGGAGAGVSMDAAAKEDKENKKKTDNLESFERLRDQLANAYNQAEIERIKAEYELRKRLQEDIYDMQEFGANRLQKQNLQFLRALAKAEQDRQDTLMDAQLRVAEAAGKIAPSAPILPSAGGAGSRMSIVDVGKALQKAGFTVKEHPAFGGVTPGVHSPRGYHPTGEAIDVTDWRGGDWKGRTAGLKQAMGGVGFAERLGPGDKGHETHVHLAVGSGGISQEMFNKALATVTGQGGIGAGAPRKIGSNESRDTMAGASVEIAQQNADLAERGGLLTKESTILKDLGRYMQEAYNVPDLTLDNQLLKARNDLLEQGVDENVINYKMRLLELDIQYKHLLKEFPKFADAANLKEEDRIKILAILAQYLGKSKDAEKAKNDETLRGIEIEKTRERDKYIKSLQDEIKLLLIIGDEERRLAEIKAQYGDAKAQEIFNLEKIKKNIEETRALIDGFVSSTTSDYKGFLKAVISGEDAADALKQFQEGLKDKVLTIFLDFAMAPVEKFLKESLEGLFLPKAKKEDGKLPEATTKDPVEATNINTTATNANTTEIKNLTTAIQGMGAGVSYSGLSEATINQGFGNIGGASFGGMQLLPYKVQRQAMLSLMAAHFRPLLQALTQQVSLATPKH